MGNLIFILFSVLLLFTCDKGAQEIRESESTTGKVISVLDGDTYDILIEGNKTIRIRMEGIDAPEKGMPFYRVSKNYLGKLCFGKTVRLDIRSKDSNGRRIAYSYLDDGTELSHEMIKAGLAWHFKKYSSDSSLSNLEIEAKKSKLGLWADKYPMSPWENRKLHKAGYSTKDSFNIKVGQE
jgi:micrococcal nuclease